jgi:hypothetical protein
MEAPKNCVPGMVNIISYCALASAHRRPVRRYGFSLSFQTLNFELYAMRFALCTTLQGRASFFMDDPKARGDVVQFFHFFYLSEI